MWLIFCTPGVWALRIGATPTRSALARARLARLLRSSAGLRDRNMLVSVGTTAVVVVARLVNGWVRNVNAMLAFQLRERFDPSIEVAPDPLFGGRTARHR